MDLNEPSWSLPKRVALRFGVVFSVLAIAPFPFDEIPGLGDRLDVAWVRAWEAIVPWAGAHFLGLPGVARDPTTGSGDTLFDWVSFAVHLAIAALAIVAWSVIDRRPRRHDRLDEWLRVALRYKLAAIMLHYGLAKVWNSQFPTPGASQLFVSFGDASPEGLLWRFMGLSTPYTMFGGVLECLGAALLCSRRTTTLGALLVIGVMANVLMLNLCYDVPVKLNASLYLGAAVFLAAPDLGRLADVLVRHRPVAARSFPPHLPDARWRRAGLALKAAFILGVLYLHVDAARTRWSTTGDGAYQPSIAGAYDVEAHTVDEEDVPHDGERLGIQRGYLALRAADGTKTALRFDLDLGARALLGEGNADRDVLHYTEDGDHLRLEGRLGGRAVTLALRRRHELVLERGFHWVTDRPFYR